MVFSKDHVVMSHTQDDEVMVEIPLCDNVKHDPTA